MRRVHGEATKCVVFMGRGVAYRKTEETDLLWSKRGPVDREGCGVLQNRGTDLCWSTTVETGVLFIGRGVAYRKTEETDFFWTSYGQYRVLLIGRGVAYRKTEETDLLRSKRGSC